MFKKTDLGNKVLFVVIGFIASAIAIIQFATGKNLPDIISIDKKNTSNTSSITSTVTPNNRISTQPSSFSETMIPPTYTPNNFENNWNGDLSVRKPTLNEIRKEIPVSLWDYNQINVKDMLQPGIDSYSGIAKTGKEYLFPVFWCSTSFDLLAENMEKINTEIIINGNTVPEKYIFIFDFETDNGWICRYHAVVLSGWLKNKDYILEIKRTFNDEIVDGVSSYEPGEYIYRLKVNVQ